MHACRSTLEDPTRKLVVQGDIENAAEIPEVTLRSGNTARLFKLDAEGGIDFEFEEIPANSRSKIRLEYGAATKEFEVVHDSTKPDIAIVQPAGGVLRTNAAKLDIEVKVTDSYLERVELDGNLMADRGGGNWRQAGVTLEREGENVFTIVAIDKAGNRQNALAKVIHDKTGPTFLDVKPAVERELEPGLKLPITLTFNEDLGSARIDGKSVKPEKSRVQFDFTVPAGEGTVTIPYDVVDLAQNHTTDSVTYVRKNKPAPPPPSITLIEPSIVDGLFYTSKETIALEARIENASEAEPLLLLDGTKVNGAFQGAGWIANVKLARDKRSKIELGYDKANRVAFDVIQDSKSPVISAVSPVSFTLLTRENSIELAVRVDEQNLSTVLLGSREMKSDGKGAWRIDALDLPRDGAFSHEVIATDRAGNQAKQTFVITRDTVAPTLRAESEPKVGASFEVGSTLQAKLSFDEAIAAVIYGEREHTPVDGMVALTLTVPDGSGDWPLEGKVRDLAGNLGDFKLLLKRTPKLAPPPPKQPESSGPTTRVTALAAPEGWRIIEPPSGSSWARKVEEPRTGIQFVLIAPGEFTMGSPSSEAEREDEEKPHRVQISAPFYMAESETTKAQYRALVPKFASDAKEAQLPVERISWTDAVAYCKQIGCELPTEAQWEFACRAGTESAFHYGKTIFATQANYAGGFVYPGGKPGVDREGTIAVKSFPPNAWGLYDMHGNVWEWCRDVYDSNAYSSLKVDDPLFEGKSKNRVVRGGAWNETPGACRSASRYKDSSSAKQDFIGFRCVKLLPSELK